MVLKNFLQFNNSSLNDYQHIDPIHNDDLHSFNYHHHDGNSNNYNFQYDHDYRSGINEHHYSNYYYDDDRSSHINNTLLHNIHIFYLNDFHDNHDNNDELFINNADRYNYNLLNNDFNPPYFHHYKYIKHAKSNNYSNYSTSNENINAVNYHN
uniref:Uncharacterized protein n=1 Tax=Plectus sambesii TaxID=2011161 RepID=A0A914WCW1_9BILA